MDPCILQKTVKDNSTELQNYMLDLKNWENGAKKKEHDVIYGIEKVSAFKLSIFSSDYIYGD